MHAEPRRNFVRVWPGRRRLRVVGAAVALRERAQEGERARALRRHHALVERELQLAALVAEHRAVEQLRRRDPLRRRGRQVAVRERALQRERGLHRAEQPGAEVGGPAVRGVRKFVRRAERRRQRLPARHVGRRERRRRRDR